MSTLLSIHFAHSAYQFESCFAARGTGHAYFQTWTEADTAARIGEAEVVVASGFWSNDLLAQADRLKYIHVCGAGYDRFDVDLIKARGVILCNSSGVNVNAVSDHAMGLLLTLTRQIHLARDRQARAEWRGMISEIAAREDELDGKCMVIYGLGAIGSRLGRLAQAFGMRVKGVRRSGGAAPVGVESVHTPDEFRTLLAEADVVALTCPLTPETEGLIDAAALAAMKPSAYLINVARGPVVDEAALVAALRDGQIAGAGLDVFDPEPLPESSALWGLENAVITPHTAGETRVYEANVLDFLVENLAKWSCGDTDFVNRIV